MAANKNLQQAKKAKNDEFYTRLEDIENEISMHSDYKKHFENKIVLCNCDDPEFSNFWIFFREQFHNFKLKKLITTHYEPGGKSYKLEWSGETLPDGTTVNVIKTPLQGDGDFRSEECIELLKEADIVVTNEPFSLTREYLAQLMEYNKKFVIIVNKNCITYKEVFPLIKDNKAWFGYTSPKDFIIPEGSNFKNVNGLCRWMTNLEIDKRTEELPLNCNYKGNEDRYPRYDNYDGINVDKVKDIPKDFDGIIGVPITFLDSYCPEQFEILKLGIGEANFTPTKKYEKFRNPKTHEFVNDKRDFLLYIKDENGKYLTSEGYRVTKCYARILIRRKNENNNTVCN